MQRASGSVLYTPLSAVKPGPIYLMGMNPGGDPSAIPCAIIDSVAPLEGISGYTHECWRKNCKEAQPCSHLADGKVRPEYRVKHQTFIERVAEAIDIPLLEIPACNAVFARSESVSRFVEQTGYRFSDWWRACWPVHQHLLSIVRPRVIITLGCGEATSPFGLLRTEAGAVSPRQVGEVGKRGGRIFDGKLPIGIGVELPVSVVGIPHPSWYECGPLLKHQLWELVRGIAT